MSKVDYEYTSLSGNGGTRLQRIFQIWTWKDSALVLLVLAVFGLIVKVVIDSKETLEIENAAFAFGTVHSLRKKQLSRLLMTTVGAIGVKSQPHIQNYSWFTDYSTLRDEDEGYVDRLWDEIIPGHGVVAVGHKWAAGKGFPKSMSLLSDDTKGVYIIDAYHQIHCLVSASLMLPTRHESLTFHKTIVRKTFYEVLRKRNLTWPIEHSMHCFDNFRQYIQCTAGDTLLHTWGVNTTGDGQQRRCRDWNVLRNWASEHTACYRDSPKPIPLMDHLGHCGNVKDDGLRTV
jgi:hypothetical protein